MQTSGGGLLNTWNTTELISLLTSKPAPGKSGSVVTEAGGNGGAGNPIMIEAKAMSDQFVGKCGAAIQDHNPQTFGIDF